jgi:starch synthase
MEARRICFVSTELAPFAKAGGLADVSAALSRFLHRRGDDVRVFFPLYSHVSENGAGLIPVDFLQDLSLELGGRIFRYSVYTAALPDSGLMVYSVRCPPLYDRPSIYTSDPDEHLRFTLLCRAALESCQRMGWAPDIIHCNDWPTALLPLYLDSVYAWDRLFEKTRTVLTIHNLGYQGVFPAGILGDLGLADRADLFPQEDLQRGSINLLKTGILRADALTTVSPTYAEEIQTEEYGMGLHEHLRARRESLTGILNGVDYGEWSPETDPFIPHRYSKEDPEGKEQNKRALLESLGLPYSPNAPVVGIISRLTLQKGFELLSRPAPAILRSRDLRLIVLGSGEPGYEELFHRLQHDHPAKVRFYNGFNNELAHWIEAGSDTFLMPSRYEPCGLNQMYSLRYGTVPIVRRTGGLADTVRLFDPETGEGTGFVFDQYDADGLSWAWNAALDAHGRPAVWRRLMSNGMSQDYSWEKSGARYDELYARLLAPAP